MSIEMALYLADVVPTFGKFLIVFGLVGTAASLSAYVPCRENDHSVKFFKFGCAASGFFALLLLGIITPSHSATDKMLIAHMVKEVQNNPKVQSIEDRLYNIIDAKLKELEENK